MTKTPQNILKSNAAYRLRKLAENPKWEAERKARYRRDIKRQQSEINTNTMKTENELTEISKALTEFDKMVESNLQPALKSLEPLFANHADAIRRVNNRHRSGKNVEDQIERLRKVFAEYQPAFTQLSDVAKKLSDHAQGICINHLTTK